jgi:hypothetical protein
VWARLVVAPWWVAWLVTAARFAVAVVALCLLGIRDFYARTGGIWGLLALVGFSLVVTAVTTRAQRAMWRSFAPTVTGLTRPERSQAVRALRRGEVPADPRVLAAAIRIGDLSMVYRRRIPKRQWWFQWLVPILWILAGALAFVGHDTRTGLTWTGLAVLLAVYYGWVSYARRRLSRRLELLHSAARSRPEVLSALAGVEDAAAPRPTTKLRLTLVVLVVVLGVIGAAVLLRDRRSPECRTANAVVGYIHANPDMLNSRLIGPGDPGPDKYRHWSEQLWAYSRQVPTGQLAPHLRRIAELSSQAVAMVDDAKRVGGPSLSTDELIARDEAYQDIIGRLIDEDRTLLPICHRQ